MRDSWNQVLEWIREDRSQQACAEIARRAAELTVFSARPEPDEPYDRRLLQDSAMGEVMLATWRAGGRSAPHDHGEAHGFVVVLAGRFSETRYEFDGTSLHTTGQREIRAGGVLRAAPGEIHDMHAREAGVTLHFYAPAIHTMRIYDLAARATLLVSGACGAWIPRCPDLLLERRSWSRTARGEATE